MRKKYKQRLTPAMREYVLAIVARLVKPSFAVLAVFLTGTFGFYALGKGRWSLLETAYFTTITLTTVGYGDVLNTFQDPVLTVFTIGLMWIGLLVTLYAVSSITALVIEQSIGKFYKEKKMLSKIASLQGHYIVCGAGATGEHVIQEFYETKRDFVLVDRDALRIEHLRERYPGLLSIVDDALDENVLEQAGISRAGGVVCTLHEDSQNMLLTVLCATSGNRRLRIVSKCIEHDLIDKFRRAGATSVVSPNYIGGLRMASEMVRPHVVSFLDKMLRHPTAPRVEEVVVTPESGLVGKTLAESRIPEKTGLQVVAVSSDGGSLYDFNPPASRQLSVGDVCIVIGEADRIEKLRRLVAG